MESERLPRAIITSALHKVDEHHLGMNWEPVHTQIFRDMGYELEFWDLAPLFPGRRGISSWQTPTRWVAITSVEDLSARVGALGVRDVIDLGVLASRYQRELAPEVSELILSSKAIRLAIDELPVKVSWSVADRARRYAYKLAVSSKSDPIFVLRLLWLTVGRIIRNFLANRGQLILDVYLRGVPSYLSQNEISLQPPLGDADQSFVKSATIRSLFAAEGLYSKLNSRKTHELTKPFELVSFDGDLAHYDFEAYWIDYPRTSVMSREEYTRRLQWSAEVFQLVLQIIRNRSKYAVYATLHPNTNQNLVVPYLSLPLGVSLIVGGGSIMLRNACVRSFVHVGGKSSMQEEAAYRKIPQIHVSLPDPLLRNLSPVGIKIPKLKRGNLRSDTVRNLKSTSAEFEQLLGESLVDFLSPSKRSEGRRVNYAPMNLGSLSEVLPKAIRSVMIARNI